MASIAEQLASLEHSRDELEHTRRSLAERIEAAARDLQQSRAELEGLTARQRAIDADVDATTKLDGDLAAARATVQDVRAGGEAELAAVRKEHRALTARIDQELSEERRTALSRAVEGIDEAIATAIRAAAEARDRLREGEQVAAEAHRRADDAAAAHEAALQRLHAVPQAMEAARARVVTARAAAATAVDAGRMAEAFVRAQDLARALDSLDEAVHVTEDQRVAEELPGLWSETLARSSDLTTATAAVQPLKDAATAAQSDHDALASAREVRIQAILSEPPGTQPDQPDGHGDPPVDGGPEPS